MMNLGVQGASPWLLIEASREGVLRFATAMPSARPRIADLYEINVEGVPTFTDTLQQYQREKGLHLRGMQCAMAIAGAASGETISLVRSRWTISRAGLAAYFGTEPVILNDVAARAWAARSGTGIIEPLRGAGMPTFDKPGRYGMIMVEEGVGAAIMDIARDGSVSVLETEAGHMDFSPANDREERLAKAARGTYAVASWEMLLMLDRLDPVWTTACPEMLDTERPRMLANMLGRFAVNLMHSFGAWQGMLITGSRAARMLQADSRTHFGAAFSTRRNFGRLVVGSAAWRVDQHEAVLTGAAERLAQSMDRRLNAAA
ncbi:glucokinase [Sphingomonas sp. SM33]|uniref:Glucokinase n=1 Tax=Sphingomonas telluris TaxID=2907998 RepID=A0ABS9VP76_9SPHN|nr:glucokinase [Sphingomonas telluris]MCH8616202.1 glucokinase [Sphingomonas telluris]